ncbi:MAG TPA: amidohydrolase family protein, partial [Burkholderiales bacterium]|nr:amidohydrolase family protein [Burkholderiales bacterium]
MIDMHAHWRPAEVLGALRERTREPRIVRNDDGVEVLKTRVGEELVSEAFDSAEAYLERMDRQGVTTSVLSLVGSFCWIESQPLETSIALCRAVNDSLSRICQEHEGRFVAHAALPLTDIAAAAAELERALALPGMIGTQIPGNGFLTAKHAEKMRPLLEVANRHRAFLFIHHGPMPGDAFPKVTGDTDNARRRNGTLDMQASLSSTMTTLCLTDFLAPYPDAIVYVHNLGGNIPYEVERMDHRCLLDTPKEELPSARFRRAKVYVDCNSFGPRAIEAAVNLYGAERIVCGTDGTEFGVTWTRKALAEAQIGEPAREKILH